MAEGAPEQPNIAKSSKDLKKEQLDKDDEQSQADKIRSEAVHALRVSLERNITAGLITPELGTGILTIYDQNLKPILEKHLKGK